MKKCVKLHLGALFMHVWMVSILYCTKGSRSEPEGGRRPHSGEYLVKFHQKFSPSQTIPINLDVKRNKHCNFVGFFAV